MHLEHLFDWTAAVSNPIDVGAGPLGGRMIVNVNGGEFKGRRLSGKVLHSGRDWALIVPDGNLRLDSRIVLKTDDGACLYVTFQARVTLTETLRRVLFERRVDMHLGESYWIAQLQFETGDERYGWLSNLMAAGEGRLLPNEVSCRAYGLEAN
jgi:hypothetical protein